MNWRTVKKDLSGIIQKIRRHWLFIIETPRARKVVKWAQTAFVTAILGYIIYQFFKIGWLNLLHSLPGNPFFYILYLPLFFLLPLTEVIIYKIIWSVPAKKLFPALLIKKVYNNEVMGYSGEVFLFLWGKRTLGKKNIDVLRNIKDNNVISVIVSILFTVIILIIFLETNPTIFSTWTRKIPNNQIYYTGISIVIIISLIIKFKRYIISLPFVTSLEIFGIHFIRHVLAVVIQIYQWHIILPEISLHVWFTYIVAQITLSMLPIIPNKDLLFISISMSMATMLGAPLAAIAAILLVNSVFDRTLHMGFYFYYQFLAQRKEEFTFLQAQETQPVTETGSLPDVETLPFKS